MHLLRSNKISHKEEMEKILKFEKKTLGNFPGLGNYISKLDSLKSELAFGEHEKYQD